MNVATKFGRWSVLASLLLVLTTAPLVCQKNSVPRPQPSRPQSAPPPRPTYQPPKDGHHSGQWLNQHRSLPLPEQKRVLERDPAFQQLPKDRQRQFVQSLQHFDTLPPDRQQQVIRRMHTWEHLTPQQKEEFRGVGSQFNSLPPERRQAVKNAIETLRAMPPAARQREIDSGRFSQFSPQERDILNGASRLPLSPSTPLSETPQNTAPDRYVPRPPQ